MSTTTRIRSMIAGVAATTFLVIAGSVGLTAPAHADPPSTTAGTVSSARGPSVCSPDFFDGDRRLGPATLPTSGPVGFELKGYHRTGSMSEADFLAQYYDPTLYNGAGGWIYPPQNGYQLRADGTPIVWRKTLPAGRTIDRFGSEYGGFLSPAGMPFAERAIPPSNLDGTPPAACNYHDYQVLKPLPVDAGPIAPWFAQRGDGWQYQLDPALIPGAPAPLNVLWLVNNGYLQRLP